jgi:hypothetical protein
MNSVYSSNLTDYNISFENLADYIICTLEYNGIVWKSKITSDDLRSGMINPTKLMNIIQSNKQTINPNYSFGIEQKYNSRTNANYLELSISYFNEFIDFEEIIYFTQANTLDEATKINQNLVIAKQQNQIDRMEKIIEKLENKINQLENNKSMTLYGCDICASYIPRNTVYGHYVTGDKKTYCNTNENEVRRLIENYGHNSHLLENLVPSMIPICTFTKNVESMHIGFKFLTNRYANIDEVNVNNFVIEKLSFNPFECSLNFYDPILVLDGKNTDWTFCEKNYNMKTFETMLEFIVLNKLIVRFNYPEFNKGQIGWLNKIQANNTINFLNKYFFRNGKKVNELIIDNNSICDELTNCVSYNKLKIVYDKSFDDNKIKAHCANHGIEFGYV